MIIRLLIILFLFHTIFVSFAYPQINYNVVPYEILPSPKTIKNKVKPQEKQAIRVYIESVLPEIRTQTSDIVRAKALRNLVYSKIKFSNGALYLPLTLAEIKEAFTGQRPMICGGLSIVYYSLLQVFGINARLVYLADAPLQNTHATVEVFLNGQWQIEDPTYNIHWELGGQSLGVLALANVYNQNISPKSDSDGFPLLPTRSVDEYPIPYKSHFSHVLIHEIDVFGSAISNFQVIYPQEPDAWTYLMYVSSLGQVSGNFLKRWDFRSGMPSDWVIGNPSVVYYNVPAAGNMLAITSDHSISNYQLLSNPFNLTPGRYLVVIDGRVIKGCMAFSILDANANKMVITQRYHFSQFMDGGTYKPMVIPLTVGANNSYRIIISNFSFTSWESQLLLGKVEIYKTG